MAEKTKNRTEIVSFRLSAEEYEPYRQALVRTNKSKTDFFREVFLTLEPKITIKEAPKESHDYKKLLFLANKASNNLNQIAYHLNTSAKAGIINRSTLNRGINLLASIEKFLRKGVRNAR